MDICTKANWTRFTKLVPEIRQNTEQWKIISVHLKEEVKSFDVINDVTVLLADFMGGWDGSIFVISEKELACFVRMGKEVDLPKFKDSIGKNLSNYNCKIAAKAATIDGVKRLEIVVTANWNKELKAELNPYQKMREGRTEKIIMVVDDDAFIRSLMAKSAAKLGNVIELSDGNELAKVYAENAPDAVFLDIHMPGKRGQELLKDINAIDPDAYVVMVSADTSRQNVIETRMDGARAFVQKPITSDKIIEALKRCRTIHPQTVFDPAKLIDMQTSPYEKKRATRSEKIIMVVDDDMFIRSLLQAAASKFGQVIELADGANAVDRYNALAPDAVFLDIHLPDRDGRDILAEIKAADPDAFIVMVSADGSPENVVGTAEKGAKGFLSKPFTPDKVVEALRKNSAFGK